MVFLAVENENRQLEDLPQADFGCVHENSSSFGKENVINWEFCEKKITSVVCFCNGSTAFFSSWALSQTHFTVFFSRIVKPIISYDTQNNTRLLAVMELLFSRSTRYQEIITVYIILLDTLFVRCFHSWDSVLNTRREIPYQHAPMYYSLCGRVKKWPSLSWSLNVKSLKSYHIQPISMRVCGSIAQRSVFIQPRNHRLLTTEKVVDECKAMKLVNKCSRKNFQGLELFDREKVCCVEVELHCSI